MHCINVVNWHKFYNTIDTHLERKLHWSTLTRKHHCCTPRKHHRSTLTRKHHCCTLTRSCYATWHFCRPATRVWYSWRKFPATDQPNYSIRRHRRRRSMNRSTTMGPGTWAALPVARDLRLLADRVGRTDSDLRPSL